MTDNTLNPENSSDFDITLASVLCSRLCHDVISPVGAIANGLEMLDGDDDEETHAMAMALIRKSAVRALAVLQFARFAFGAAGTAGETIDLSWIRTLGDQFISTGRTTLRWQTDSRESLDKAYARLLLNIIPLAAAAIPRGGVIEVILTGDENRPDIVLKASGPGARLPADIATPMEATGHQPDTRNIQAVLARALAHELARRLEWNQADDEITLSLQ